MLQPFKQRDSFSVSLNTTEDCNLACKYCYEINKKRKTLSIQTAKDFIDLLLRDDDPCDVASRKKAQLLSSPTLYDSITFDLIGGDALMKPKLCDEILTHIANRLYTWNTPNAIKWRKNWRVSISTNGTLFSNPDVRSFIEDWLGVLSIGVSVDGCPELHDLNRVYLDGRGSMKDILKNWDWYKAHFPIESLSTKSTLARNSIPYMYDSLKFLLEEMGICEINQNFIMEDTHCTEADYELLKDQMQKCVDYVLEHCDEMYWSMIREQDAAHHAPDEDWFTQGWCGSGSMPTVGIDGKIYPCFRWLPHTFEEEQKSICVGDVKHGFCNKQGFTRVQEGGIRANCSKDPKCKTCEYESACAYCIGGCYAEYGDFVRTTHICEITKIRCDYARKYWNAYNKLKGIEKEYK